MSPRLALVLGLSVLGGCISYCKADPLLEGAARGDRDAIHETGELGRPRVPSTAELLPGPIRAFEALRPHLRSRDPATRLAALEALRVLSERMPDIVRNHFPDLFEAPLADPEAGIRWRAAWALGRIGVATPGLRTAALDPSDDVAAEALLALGRAHDDGSLGALARGLDRPGAVRAAAIQALVRLHGRELPDAAAWKRHLEERQRVLATLAPVSSADAASIRS